ncbi:hypothetical protein KBI52_22185 [Microvirga sp. HBU67558]|uniref:hypothetical protein n=1 Tax=Microvirga TaxID=186650 RepID=UPI001B39CAD2|nr:MULTISPECIES: hypothetical protein [unclassified Microvirga]MBQ0822901.1 hypothetical protein [Microvirga sp. HBU67558]
MQRLLIIPVLTVTAGLLDSAALAQQQFDGRWSVHAIPEKGACRRAHYYTVVVEDGVARNAASRRTSDKVTGGLEASGRVRGSVQRQGTRTDITGTLTERSGSGHWTIAGRIACSGRWTASKWG